MSAEPLRKRAYTPDIGWRVVWNRIAMDMSFTDIGRRLQIAPSTAHRIFKRFLRTDNVALRKQPSCRPQWRVLDEYHEVFLIALVMENPCTYMYLSEKICDQMKSATGINVSASTICRTLKRQGFTRKKIQVVAKQRSQACRSHFIAQILGFTSDYFVWIDETGCDARNYVRKFGYSLKGLAPVSHRFIYRDKRISALTAISEEGLLAVELKHGTVNSDVFYDFIDT